MFNLLLCRSYIKVPCPNPQDIAWQNNTLPDNIVQFDVHILCSYPGNWTERWMNEQTDRRMDGSKHYLKAQIIRR